MMNKHVVQTHPIRLRDGEVVVYRRSRRLIYQCRYKLSDGTWQRQTTGKAAIEHAIAKACDIYDENLTDPGEHSSQSSVRWGCQCLC